VHVIEKLCRLALTVGEEPFEDGAFVRLRGKAPRAIALRAILAHVSHHRP
jgi:hypothetical protein